MKFLFIRLSSLGDIVLTTGILGWVKKNYPNSEIHFITKQSFASLLKFCPHIDKIISIEDNLSYGDLKNKFSSNKESYSYIFDLHNNIRSHAICSAFKSPVYKYKKSSFSRRVYTKFRIGRSFIDSSHVCLKYAKPVIGAFDLKQPKLNDLRPSLKIDKNELNYKSPIAIHPFASKATKEWPYIHELCNQLIEQGHTPIIIGRTKKNILFPDGVVSYINKTTLPEMTKLINSCKALITTDSGPMHIGVALGLPVFSIFGSTVELFGFSPAHFDNCHILQNSELNCRPCHVHGLDSCPKKHFKCMTDIKPESIIELIQSSVL